MPSWTKYLWIILLSLVTPETVLAHSGEGITGGLMGGFIHPLTELDHFSVKDACHLCSVRY